MKLKNLNHVICIGLTFSALACDSSSPSNSSNNESDSSDVGNQNNNDLTEEPAVLHSAFSEFSSNVQASLTGNTIVITSNGLPDHTSPYWSNTTARSTDGITTAAASADHPLFVEPTITSFDNMAPGNIDDFNGSYSLSVSANPTVQNFTTSTGLGAIGIAISGAMIYNDEEGPGIALDAAVPSLDYTAAHTGPQSYHYHMEPRAWSNSDSNLIGIMADGFFLYGLLEADGSLPTGLDESGGHFGPTVHNPDGEYHYHIQNELYLGQYYILFPGDYQGTPSTIQ